MKQNYITRLIQPHSSKLDYELRTYRLTEATIVCVHTVPLKMSPHAPWVISRNDIVTAWNGNHKKHWCVDKMYPSISEKTQTATKWYRKTPSEIIICPRYRSMWTFAVNVHPLSWVKHSRRAACSIGMHCSLNMQLLVTRIVLYNRWTLASCLMLWEMAGI